MWFFEKKQKTNYGKIIAITVAVVAGVSAVAFIVYKLAQKFFSCCECDCGEDLLDEFDCECDCECDCCCDEDEDEACECCCEAEAAAE